MRFIIALLLSASIASAHEMVPTYPAWWNATEANGLLKTNLSIWNRRKDVTYYEIEVFDRNFEPRQFATQEKVIKVNYLQRKTFSIFIKTEDRDNVTYICTRSRLLKDNVQTSGVSSRICSKAK
jgi:hypothetical protein